MLCTNKTTGTTQHSFGLSAPPRCHARCHTDLWDNRSNGLLKFLRPRIISSTVWYEGFASLPRSEPQKNETDLVWCAAGALADPMSGG